MQEINLNVFIMQIPIYDFTSADSGQQSDSRQVFDCVRGECSEDQSVNKVYTVTCNGMNYC